MIVKVGNSQSGDAAALEVEATAPLAGTLADRGDGEITVTVAYSPTPEAALTAADGGTVDGTYGAAEAAVISNNVTRIGEIEAALIAHGLLAAPE